MPPTHPRPALRPGATVLAALVTAACLTGCGRADAHGAADARAASDSAAAVAPDAAASPAAATAAPATGSADAPLTVADVDRWARGMTAELEAVQAAGARLRAAGSGADTAGAMLAATEMSTEAGGARAAGVDLERYRRLRRELSGVAELMAPLDQEMNVGALPPAMVAEMRKGRETALARVSRALPPEVVEAVRPRAAALRAQEVALVGARLQAAGRGR